MHTTNDDTPIPAMGLGTFRLKGEDAYNAVRTALKLGYRHIDTAQIYGNEQDVGRAIADSGVPREELFVTTKIWTDHFAEGKLIPSLRESLDKLQLEQVDLTLIHWPSPGGDVPMQVYLGQLMDAREQGLTRLTGVSNFTIDLLNEAFELVGPDNIATNQVEIHPFLQNRKLVEFAREENLHLTAYMPLAVGKVMQDETLDRIAEEHGATPPQVAMAWLMQQGIAVIPSSTKRLHLESNLAADRVRLSADDLNFIERLDAGGRIANPDFAPEWD